MTKRRRFSKGVKMFFFVVLILVVVSLVLFFYHTSVTQNTDSYIYELPFQKGASHRVVQGYGGLFSHRYTAALDFYMPVGTPVYAARGGTVYRYKDDSDEGGISSRYRRKANYIIIQHEDGSFGCYWHLQKNGVLFKSGAVSQGQQIGFSGATGEVFGPHLHFSVKRIFGYDMNSFVRTRFSTSKGVVFLKQGSVYEKP